ncbi:MAG: cytidylate kinase-like family protein [Phycisphaerales bacterium]|nr:cytidylate kinase-like family protein [Phycisphaerales bacterium]MCB9854360.1 cytidylate kinase-like family protein [Phycisphaerales bacterium]MCB9863561.1 cytidylate kinase-like family protein [Phycisphaerales bacterium]
MAIRTLSEKRTTNQMLERQMRNWEIARSQDHRQKADADMPAAVKEFVTISRSVGLPGAALAERLNERLGWPVFDRELLRTMAGDDACRARIFRDLDERAENWVQAFVRGFLQPTFVGREAYFNRLVETVAALSRSAPGIFIGRGVDLILPRDLGLRVRLTADRAFCATQYAADHGVTYDAAMREIEAIERDRARYIKQNFHVLPDEASRFDLVVNLERVTINEAIDLVFAVMRSRGIVK